MVEQDLAERDLAEQDLVEHSFAEPRPRSGCDAAPQCIVCTARGRLPCSMRRAATSADGPTSDRSAIAGVPRNRAVAVIDNTIIEKAWAG
jgi:hypothetical protein